MSDQGDLDALEIARKALRDKVAATGRSLEFTNSDVTRAAEMLRVLANKFNVEWRQEVVVFLCSLTLQVYAQGFDLMSNKEILLAVANAQAYFPAEYKSWIDGDS